MTEQARKEAKAKLGSMLLEIKAKTNLPAIAENARPVVRSHATEAFVDFINTGRGGEAFEGFKGTILLRHLLEGVERYLEAVRALPYGRLTCSDCHGCGGHNLGPMSDMSGRTEARCCKCDGTGFMLRWEDHAVKTKRLYRECSSRAPRGNRRPQSA